MKRINGLQISGAKSTRRPVRFKYLMFMLKQACRFIHELRGKAKISCLSVNFSQKTILWDNFYTLLTGVIFRYSFPANSVQVEVDELALMGDKCILRKNIEILRAFGISTSLDNFGYTGMPFSLLPTDLVDELKLDKSLADTILENEETYRIMNMISTFCRDNQLFTIVEGVDSAAEQHIMQELGFDAVQGDYYAKPMGLLEYLRFCEVHEFYQEIEK